MTQCHCLKTDGTPCTREASTKSTDDPKFCWQHQNCQKESPITTSDPKMAGSIVLAKKIKKINTEMAGSIVLVKKILPKAIEASETLRLSMFFNNKIFTPAPTKTLSKASILKV